MHSTKFSVLMSLYIKERPEYFTECMESILRQTELPDEIVIVLDGPVQPGVEAEIEKYRSRHPGLIRLVPLIENVGLGPALAEGILHCTHELIARMDTDDVCREDRFERQLSEFESDDSLDICGCHIKEFSGTVDNVISSRSVPLTHDEIAEYQRQRSAFNHMTVMYKKSAVIRAGNYQDAPLMEDDLLWVHMLMSGAVCKNIDDFLVYVRTGDAMIARRGGYAYFKKYKNGRKMILDTGYIGRWDYYKTVGVQFAVALMPARIRTLIFTKLLRR